MKKKIFICGIIGISFSLCVTACAGQQNVHEENQIVSDSSSYEKESVRARTSIENESEKMEGRGFETPEEAALTYLKNLKELNFEQLLSAFAVETYVENFRLDKQINELGAYGYHDSILPSVSKYTEKLNIERRRYNILANIKEEYLLLLGLLSGNSVPLAENVSGKALLDELFTWNADTCFTAIDYDGTFIDLAYMMDEYWEASNSWEEQVDIWMQRELNCSGADCLECVAVNFTYAGEPLAINMSVAQYDGRWYIYELGGVYSTMLGADGHPSGGGLIPGVESEEGQIVGAISESSEIESVLSKEDNIKVESDGYNTAIEAAVAYLEGFQKNNIDQMMEAFAVETYVDNFHLDRYVENEGEYRIGSPFIPNNDEHMKQLNAEMRRVRIAGQIRNQYLIMTGAMSKIEEYGDVAMIGISEEITGEELLKSIFATDDNVYLSNINYRNIFAIDEYPNEVSDSFLEHVKSVKEEMTYLGADQIESLSADIVINRTSYKMGIDTVCYDGRWYVLELGDFICEQENNSNAGE